MNKTLKSLKAVSKKVDLIHPESGDTGAWINVRTVRCNEYLEYIADLDRVEGEEKPSYKDNRKATAALTSILVTGWDESFFEMPYTREHCTEVLLDAENYWIRDLINAAQEDQSGFFPNN